jgi:hypothetical protein
MHVTALRLMSCPGAIGEGEGGPKRAGTMSGLEPAPELSAR